MIRYFQSLALMFMLVVLAVSTGKAQKKEEFKSYYRISDIPYTENKSLRTNQLDIYMPKKGSKSAVVIWVHGGNWNSGDKRDVDVIPEYFTSKGYIFVALNYRLAPGVTYRDQASDIAHAIVWSYNNVIHYSGDKNKIILVGVGTGAQLATTVMLNDDYLQAKQGSRAMVRGVASLEGMGFYIPDVLSAEGNKFREGCFAAIGSAPHAWEDASPVVQIRSGNGIPPFLLAYAAGKPVLETDARVMADKLTDHEVKARIAAYTSRSSITRDLGKEGDKLSNDLLVFMNTCFTSQ
jgi:arylformamidase